MDTLPTGPTSTAIADRIRYMDELKTHAYFRDWQIDHLVIREGDCLTLELSLDGQRATITFAGTGRCVVERFGLTNIVYDIRILQPDDLRYERALRRLAQPAEDPHASGHSIAHVLATAGTGIIVEFNALGIEISPTD